MIRHDNAATIMGALPPLLAGCPPPSRGLPLQQAVDSGQYNGNLTAINELTAMDDNGRGSTSDGWRGAKAMDDSTST